MDDIDQAHDDDIGAEMDDLERFEMRLLRAEPDDEPDAQAMVGALLAQIGYLVTDLAEPDTAALLCDGDREELTQTLVGLDKALEQLITIRDDVAQELGNMMEGKVESIAGHAVTRDRADKVEWDKTGAWQSVRASILERWAMDGDNLDRRAVEIIDRTLSDIAVVYTSRTPTIKGLQALNVNPFEYRATTPATRWNVKVQ